MEYKQKGDEPSKPQWAFQCLQNELAKREEALRVAIAEVSTLQALLETKRQSSTFDPTMDREMVRLWHSHDKLREVARFGPRCSRTASHLCSRWPHSSHWFWEAMSSSV